MTVLTAPRAPEPAAGPLAPLLEAAAEPCGAELAAAVEQAATLLDQACVHLPGWNAQGIDPVARLRRLGGRPPATRGELYRGLLAIFAELGDQHTQCYLPEPFAASVAFLPFVVRDFHEHGRRRLLVVSSAVEAPRRGDLLLSWNGVPAERALEEHMALQLSAGEEARRGKALQTLTFRPLAWLPPPAAEEAVLEFAGGDGRRREVRLAWQVASSAWLKEHLTAALGEEGETGAPLRAGRVETSHGTFGHLRVASFEERPAPFLAAFLAALEQMPPRGLILDLRGCEKGIIPTGEQLLQLFTPDKIEPLRFQFRVTPLVQHLVRTCPALHDWRDAVEAAVRRGEEYSEGRPLTSPEEANGVGRRYSGPVLVLADALTYSTAEMVAAGFQDHGIGPVLGTAGHTGGGGGSPWSQGTVCKLSGDEALRPLPGAPQIRVAVRRCRRSGARAGQPIEGVGVIPDGLHRPARADRLDGDVELMETAGRWLAEMGR